MANIATNTVTPMVNTFPVRVVVEGYTSAAGTAGQILKDFKMPCNGRIIGVAADGDVAGTGGGNTVLDVLVKSGSATTFTSIYTTTANRPTLVAVNTGEFAAGLPDTRNLLKGDVVQLQVLTVSTTGHGRIALSVAIGMP